MCKFFQPGGLEAVLATLRSISSSAHRASFVREAAEVAIANLSSKPGDLL